MDIDVIDHPEADPRALPASTVVLVRDADGEIEVLMVHRGAETTFGGMWAFPGGVIEDGDVPAGTAPDPLPAARQGAVREAHEETGLDIDAGSLVFWSHWLPPVRSLQRKRYSTWFFVAPAAPHHVDDHIEVDGAEIHAHRWLPPAVALGLQEQHELLLAPPTYVTLQQLCRYGDVESVLAAVEPTYFASEIGFTGDVRHLLWSGDVAYGGGDPALPGPRHRLVMDDEHGWRYLNTAAVAGGS